MAIRAAIGDIEDIFLGMVVFRLCSIVAVIAGICWGVGGVAAGAYPVCVFVIDRECVTIDLDTAPRVVIMTLRALTVPVIVWSRMAGLAIRLSVVVEASWSPCVCVMAG